jgi:hypothetical protein
LNEKERAEIEPVPAASTPYTLLEPGLPAVELSTVKTHVRTFAV